MSKIVNINDVDIKNDEKSMERIKLRRLRTKQLIEFRLNQIKSEKSLKDNKDCQIALKKFYSEIKLKNDDAEQENGVVNPIEKSDHPC